MVSRKDNKGRALRKGESQRKDGYYIYQYTDVSNKRRVIYAKDLVHLREREQNIHRDIGDNIDSYASENTTLNMAYDRYMSSKVNLKESTKVNYNYMYDLTVRDTLGRRNVKKIRYSDMKAFYITFLVSGRFQMRSIEIIHTLLHPTFTMLVRDGIIRTNPTDGIIAELKKNSSWEKKKRHALTIPEQKAFMSYAADSPVFNHWLPLFVVFLGTGGRVGEITGLCWSDIDFDKRLITIRRSLLYRLQKDGHCDFHISTPKTKAGIRMIPMIDKVYEILIAEYEEQRERGFSSCIVDECSGFVFTNRFDGVLNPMSINRAIKRVYEYYNLEELERAKREKRLPLLLPHISCHIFRHTFCTRYCEVEKNVKVIQEVMGHADITTTMNIYAEATEDKKKESLLMCQNTIMIM